TLLLGYGRATALTLGIDLRKIGAKERSLADLHQENPLLAARRVEKQGQAQGQGVVDDDGKRGHSKHHYKAAKYRRQGGPAVTHPRPEHGLEQAAAVQRVGGQEVQKEQEPVDVKK